MSAQTKALDPARGVIAGVLIGLPIWAGLFLLGRLAARAWGIA